MRFFQPGIPGPAWRPVNFVCGILRGFYVPGIAVVFPTYYGPVTICDVGANIACKPVNLYQYAVMSSIYAQEMLGISNPRIGLMNIGEEDAKGQ